MAVDRVKFNEIVASQLPQYVQESFPLLEQFLEQYYISQEYQSGPIDIANNIDQYVKVDELFNLVNSTTLADDVDYTQQSVEVDSTIGFTENNGIIRIDNEIIYYETKTDTTFVNCYRGFSGVTTYITSGAPDDLTFSKTEADAHTKGATVQNLNVLFLQQFFQKLKKQVTPGFTERNFYKGLNQRNFIYNAKDFYTSKGTDQSYEILFRALYGEDVEVIKPSRFLLTPSNADYKVTQDFVVEKVQGDPLDLQNLTLFQKATGARGSVTNVQKLPYADHQYYQISIDAGFARDSDVSGTIFGEFKPNPTTKILNTVAIGATVLDVDSTVGFPEYGNLTTFDVDGDIVGLGYSGKTSNQFYNVTGNTNTIYKTTDLHLDSYSYSYVGIGTDEQIKVRLTSTLKNFVQSDNAFYYKKNDTINIKSLGYEAPGKKSNNWSLNVKTSWKIAETDVVDADAFSYKFLFYDTHFFQEGYTVLYENFDRTQSYFGSIFRVVSAKEVIVNFSMPIEMQGEFYLENQLLKGDSSRYPYLNKFTANIVNTYAKFNSDVLVTSNTIPKYNNVPTNPYDKKITFSTTLLGTDVLTLPVNPTNLPDHGYYTGDPVYFQSEGDGFEGITSGSYFVFRIDEKSIKLSRSLADLSKKRYLQLNGSVVNASLSYLSFYQKTIQPQGIYRQLLQPVDPNRLKLTQAGFTGIFINGVELLNYKSQNSVYYGEIENFSMTSGGYGYDINNPPLFVISDEVGVGAAGVCNVKGQLERLEVTDTGMGYYKVPTIKISGGNGTGAAARARMISITHENAFVSDFPSQVDLVKNQIIFPTDHKFLDGERVIYEPRGTKVISGLATNSEYYTQIIGPTTIRLHKTFASVYSGIGTVELGSFGNGTQYLVSTQKKSVVSSVVITNPGQNYENKNRTIPTVGVNTASNQFEIPNHGYQSQQVIRYIKNETNPVVGLKTDTDYYVVKVNDDAFSLTEVGVGTIGKNYYFDNNIIIPLTNSGIGSFNYPPIVVTIEGAAAAYDKSFVEGFQELFVIESPIQSNIITPVNSLAWSDNEAEILVPYYVAILDPVSSWLISDDPFVADNRFYDAKLQPIFRGSIESIDIQNGGVGYGSSDIINFQRQPAITFESGKGAKLTPIINNGKITEVIINLPGYGYNSPPDLQIVSDTGNFALLVPIVTDGKITEVIVRKGGAGYTSGKTDINVIAAGLGARTQANFNSWGVNLFERNFNNILDDDGFISENISDTSLEYCTMYAPRALRRSLNVINGFNEDNLQYGIFDLSLNRKDEEIANQFHSPIVGWAYDGNPIYGPYGFENVDGTGNITRMISGYKLRLTSINRPSYDAFPNGFFTDDYIFTGDGNLDEFNGRFCVTPDYPDGVYAYFCTIAEDIDSSGPFIGYRRPVFPYVIGDKFKSEPNTFNFTSLSNQTDYDVQMDGWLRNTKFYFTGGGNAEYDYIFNSNNIRNQAFDVIASSQGSIDSVTILDRGTNYKVNDRVVFKSEGTGGRNANYKVGAIQGKKVDGVSLATTSFNDVEIVSSSRPNTFVGISSIAHNLNTFDIVYIDALSENFAGFQGAYSVGVSSDRWYTNLGIQTGTTTGIVTYIYVNGLDGSQLVPNDILNIDFEKFKVLNIDVPSSRLRVLRGYNNTLTVTHTAGTVVRDEPRRISFTNLGVQTSKVFAPNKEFYFQPSEALGVGTAVGITTLVFSNPGVGATQERVTQQQIYLPKHKLTLNTPMKYYTNGGGTSVNVWSGVENTSPYPLTDTRDVYAVPLSEDVIGIASCKVGVSTITSEYVGVTSEFGGLLYFMSSVGLGSYHSFKTNIPTVFSSRVSKNTVTVSTASTHGLKTGDIVDVDVNPIDTKEIKVIYNDYNRRFVFDPDTIQPVGINTNAKTFAVPVNKYQLGDKILYTSETPSENLYSNNFYYVYPYKTGHIKLVEHASELTKGNPKFVNVSTASTGTFAKVNPQITIQKNQNLKFNLSDQSLSFTSSAIKFAAFDMFIYSDSRYVNKFWLEPGAKNFNVTKTGTVGVTTDASLNLYIGDSIPPNLYYNFETDNNNLVPPVKLTKYTDTNVINNNQINIVDNKFDGKFAVTGVTTESFDYSIPFNKDSIVSYGSTNAIINYDTTSRNASGPVANIFATEKGIGYKSLPGFTSIRSAKGTGALLQPNSTTIGNILETQFNYIGFGYPSDNTLNAVTNLPEILKVDPLASFESIGISSAGINYTFAPNLVVIDGLTNKQITDVRLLYQTGDNQVSIIENTINLNKVPPTFIPINNSNGFGIGSVTYNENTKVVRLEFTKQFSDAKDWPFKVGETVLVENVAVGLNTAGTGYNSEDYDYALFEVTALDSQLGGSGAYIEYNLSDYLLPGQYPGKITNVTAGAVVPKTYFPIFNPVLFTSSFFDGENVFNSTGATGTVERWDPISEYLFVSTDKDFPVGSIIQSETSKIRSLVKEKIDFDSKVVIGAGTTYNDGWQSNSGMLNDNLQVIPNNEYYQKFSYSLKSRVDYETWNDPVSSLNHTAGFDKYADFVIDNNAVGIATAVDIDLETVVDVIGEIELNCYPDFDGASENSIYINSGKLVSNQIVFENRILIDYFESKNNRVLRIDDFSDKFNSNPRTTKYSIVDFVHDRFTFNKFFTLVQDTELRNRKQFNIVNVLQDGNQGYVNQYGTIDTGKYLGFYGYIDAGKNWGLTFHPVEFEYNNYEVSYASISVLDNAVGIGTDQLGDVCRISTAQTSVAFNTTTNIVSISSTYRAAKALIQLEDTDNNFFCNELNILQYGSTVEILQYGDINNSTNQAEFSGFGTYHAYLDGGQLKVDIVPSISTSFTANANIIALSDGATGVSTETLVVSNVSSYSVDIASSGSPTANVVASYNSPYNCEYFIVSASDTTNNEYEMFECMVLNNDENQEIVQYARIYSSAPIGTVGVTSTGTYTNLTFTPNAGIDVKVRVFGISNKNYNDVVGISSINLQNNIIFSDYGEYTGTEFDKKTSFTLKHDELPIFERTFEGNNASVVSVNGNFILLEDHYFVTGEKINYKYENSTASTANAISIAPTTIAGVTTDKLPAELYVIKYSEKNIGFAASAFDALSTVPVALDITSVGVGTFHQITATNQNAKCLLAVDNQIQAPLTKAKIDTRLDENVVFDADFDVVGITSFKATDLIQVDNEIMKIQDVGVGATNRFRVLRAQMGTKVASHNIGTSVELLAGNYNIVENTIYFSEAPAGGTPIGTTTDGPDNVDWTGITTYSTFQGRTFMRSGIENSTLDTYATNYTFDNIQAQFNGTSKYFSLTVDGANVTGFSTNQAIVFNSNVLQEPQGAQATSSDFDLQETAGVTSITYLGNLSSIGYDPNRADIPRGGIVVSVASTQGFGYQPLVGAGASVTVSTGGSITAITIGNNGSGYRSGIQTHVSVGIMTQRLGAAYVEGIGTATISGGRVVSIALTSASAGLDYNNPPQVVIDEPLPYGNIPLLYASDSAEGIGTGAKADIVVGAGSSVIDFYINQGGYGYNIGEKLTFSTQNLTGIPTDTSLPFEEFQFEITDVFRDTFNAFTIGELDIFDSLDDQFDNETTKFNLTIADAPFAIESAKGSLVNVSQTLIVTINDILQVPGSGYNFTGGSVIEFSEPPRKGDSSKIIFYKGTPEVDVMLVDILETVKVGDTLQLRNDSSKGQSFGLYQDPRIVSGITTLDTVKTVTYDGPGITTDNTLVRPIAWYKQIDDITINGEFVTKDRIEYEPLIYPAAYLTSYVGVTSSYAYVDSVRPLFDQNNETALLEYQDRVTITDQGDISPAIAEATITNGNVTNISLTQVGAGYSHLTNPVVTIGEPPIVGGVRAEASAIVVGDSVQSILITEKGNGYTQPPSVMIQQPSVRRESVAISSYFGDSGVIVGFALTTGNANAILDLYIPGNSFMRDPEYVGIAVTVSGISAGDFFVVNESSGIFGTIDTDNIYRCTSASNVTVDLTSIGIGTTVVRRVEFPFTAIGSTNFSSTQIFFDATPTKFDNQAGILTGTGNMSYAPAYGEFTWGKINFINRTSATAVEFWPESYQGLSTSTLIQRETPLKYNNYTS